MPPARKNTARKSRPKAAAAKPRGKAKTSRTGGAARWTEQQVQLLKDTVATSPTAKAAFEKVARELGKSTGTVQQKWYNMQKAGGRRPGRPGRRPGRPRGAAPTSGSGRSAANGSLRSMPTDDLVALARSVREELDRRRRELDQAAELFR